MSENCFVAAFKGLHPGSARAAARMKKTGKPYHDGDSTYCGAPISDEWYGIWEVQIEGNLINVDWAEASEGCEIVTLWIDGTSGTTDAAHYRDGELVWEAGCIPGYDEALGEDGLPIVKGAPPPGEAALRTASAEEDPDDADPFNFVIELAECVVGKPRVVETADGGKLKLWFYQPNDEVAEELTFVG